MKSLFFFEHLKIHEKKMQLKIKIKKKIVVAGFHNKTKNKINN